MTKPLLTDEQRAQLLANGRQSIDHPDFDPKPVVKLFTPDAHATWLLAELNPTDGDTAYGLCDIGIGMPELGTLGPGIHRRAAEAARCARPVLHGEAHAVGVPAARPHQWFVHRLIEPYGPLRRAIQLP